MSTVTRYACITASGIGGVRVVESENGRFVMHEDYAALEAQRDALAAEVVALREYRPQPNGAAMMEALDALYESEDVPEQGMKEAFEILCCKRPQTPATDAFLREQMAKGVEIFADKTEECGWHESTTRYVRKFAVQLRAGEAV